MIRQFFLFAFLILSVPGYSQFTKIFSASVEHSWFNCDSEKNIYTVSGNHLLKYSPPYDSSKTYNLLKEGIPGYIDINNSNKIVLFYQESRKVVLLDSTLHEVMRPFYLDELGMYEVSLITSSGDGGLWFYNYSRNSMTKLNSSFLPLVPFLGLNPYFQAPSAPNYIVAFEGKLYLNVPSTGILVVNQSGSYNSAIQLRGLIDFQVDGKIIYFYRDYIIYCYDIKTLKIRKIYMPDEPGIQNAWFYKNQIILQVKDGFSVYNHEISPLENQ